MHVNHGVDVELADSLTSPYGFQELNSGCLGWQKCFYQMNHPAGLK